MEPRREAGGGSVPWGLIYPGPSGLCVGSALGPGRAPEKQGSQAQLSQVTSFPAEVFAACGQGEVPLECLPSDQTP